MNMHISFASKHNKAIENLYEKWLSKLADQTSDYHVWCEKEMKPEFLKLYNADDTAIYTSHINLKRMLAMNHSKRFVQLHMFYININASV